MATRQRTGEARRRRASLRIGSLAGIDVRVHVSILLLVAFVVVTAAAPGGPTVAGHLVWMVLVLAAITLHELAHGVVARAYGSPVEEIDLLPIGGVSKLGRLPDDPGQQLQVAVAGPLASVGIGVAAGVTALAAGSSLWPPDIFEAALVVRLAWVNVLLAAFNLLPAFPMDGGRALRALLAMRMDGDRATVVAARFGRQIAAAMIVAGVLLNLWVAVVGAVVLAGSFAEETAAVVHRALDDVRVRDVMVPHLPSHLVGRLSAPVDADAALLDTDLLTADFAARPAVRDGEVVGYVVEDDVTARADDLIARERARFGRAGPGPTDRPA